MEDRSVLIVRPSVAAYVRYVIGSPLLLAMVGLGVFRGLSRGTSEAEIMVLVFAGTLIYLTAYFRTMAISVDEETITFPRFIGANTHVPRQDVTGLAFRDMGSGISRYPVVVFYGPPGRRIVWKASRAFWNEESLLRVAKLLGIDPTLDRATVTRGQFNEEFHR